MKKAMMIGLASGLLGLAAAGPASALTTFTTSGFCGTPVVGSCSINLSQLWSQWTGSSNASITIEHNINDTSGDDQYILNGIQFGVSLTDWPNEQPETFDVSAIMAISGGAAIFTVNSSDIDGQFNDGAGWNVTLTSNIPEPVSLALFGLGLAGLGFSRRKLPC
jgi:PEP-CTERM motif